MNAIVVVIGKSTNLGDVPKSTDPLDSIVDD